MCIPVHSPWLPVYTDVAQIILVILRRLDFFQTDVVYHANKKYKKAEVAILLLKKKRKWDIYTWYNSQFIRKHNIHKYVYAKNRASKYMKKKSGQN